MGLDLISDLKKAFNGDAWHGRNLMQQLNFVKPENAFHHFIPNTHSIAELVLHITAWTDEVNSRLLGAMAKEPTAGDWPMPNSHTLKEWEKIVFDCKTSNEELIRVCEGLEDAGWNAQVKDERNRELGSGVTNAELISGLIQHHAYHSGQIALLLKFNVNPSIGEIF
ncbi:MAG: hypothetical protein EOO07_08810 [Chitinophagaceae bacterium]|nr:MAG: hypothetical protein EOO07_08810 [Chitinophagaceae bacterium]